jgi:SAM-dependent methyltransferase
MIAADADQIRKLPRERARDLDSWEHHYSTYVGPAKLWDVLGAAQFRLLTALGLREHHRLLDVGCGALRAGRLLMMYLNRGCYFGIEPNMWLVEDAIAGEVGREFIALKAPAFSDSADFAADSFGVPFDFILANSIFSHAGPDMLEQALGKFAATLAPGGLIAATFVRADLRPGFPIETPGWTYPGCTAYQPETLTRLFEQAGLVGRVLPWFHPLQSWYVIGRHPEDLPPPVQDRHLTGAILRDAELAASLDGSR